MSHVSILCLPANVCTAHCPLFLDAPHLSLLPIFQGPTQTPLKGLLDFFPADPHNYAVVDIHTCKSLFYLYRHIIISSKLPSLNKSIRVD